MINVDIKYHLKILIFIYKDQFNDKQPVIFPLLLSKLNVNHSEVGAHLKISLPECALRTHAFIGPDSGARTFKSC